MNTTYIKAALVYHFRYIKQYCYVATEVINNYDIGVLDSKKLIEIEIKISKQDFKNEFTKKIYKHQTYKDVYKDEIKPNYFYFCITEELKDYVLRESEKLNPNYGIMVCYNRKMGNNIKIIKKAKPLHKNYPKIGLHWDFGKRMSSEIATFYLNNLRKV